MAQEIPVFLDPSLGVAPADLKAAWDSDLDAQQVGRLQERPSGKEFTGFVELVVIPVAVGVTVKVAGDLITEAIKKLLAAMKKGPATVEKQTLPGGQEAVVAQKK
jgi:hypothetical protein